MSLFKSNPEIVSCWQLSTVSCLSGDLIHFTINFKIWWILSWSGKPSVGTWMPFCYGILWIICLQILLRICTDLYWKPAQELLFPVWASGMKKTTTLKCCNGFTFGFCLFVWVWSRHAQELYEKLQGNAEATRFAWRLCTLSKCEGSGHR